MRETPQDWPSAFAALPQESPPTDGWRAIGQRLDGQRVPRRRPAWLAVAAAAALVAIALWPRSPDTPTPERVATAPTTAIPASTPASTPVEPTHGRLPSPAPTTVATTTPPATGHKPAPTTLATEDVAPGMARLYEESAQLEALIAAARDDSAGSASALLLAEAFDAQVARIDAALGNPASDEATREQLWQARVDTLRQAAGFAGTQRLLATQGHEDTLLVSVD